MKLYNKVKVIINGNWIGITNTPDKFYLYLKDKKYKGIINIYTSIVFDYKYKEIIVCNDAGRLTRPVFKIKNNKLLMDKNCIKDIKNKNFEWDDLLVKHKYKNSIIEYIDSDEQNASLICIKSDKLKIKK